MKVVFIFTCTRILDVNVEDYKDEENLNQIPTQEEAINIARDGITNDPFSFIDSGPGQIIDVSVTSISLE